MAAEDGGESDAEEGGVDDFEAGLEVFSRAEYTEGQNTQDAAGDLLSTQLQRLLRHS